MSLLLYINGQQADLETGQAIAQTKQVNDLNSLDDRQASYTNKFRLPKTGTNLRIMQYLTLPGNTSEVPYQKNECTLYSETGECFVYKGWANITDGGDSFEVVIYDGIIDFFRAIENTTLADLDLTELIHEKNPLQVLGSWQDEEAKFRYIVADYNGDTGPAADTTPTVHIDYLVPSVNVKYLWDKIFEKYVFRSTGSVFDTQAFRNLWMTYPKGVSTSDSDVLVFESADWQWVINYLQFFASYPMRYLSADTNLLAAPNPVHLKVAESGSYRLEVSGIIMVDKSPSLVVCKNAEGNTVAAPPLITLGWHINSGNPFNFVTVLDLNAGDSICLVFRKVNSNFRFFDGTDISVNITKVTANTIDFKEAFKDFPTKDFLKEVVHRFGLTMFKEANSNVYNFLTLQEQLQSAQVADWTAKFCRKVNEKYIAGTYAKRNWFRYAYNDKESSHADWFIDVDNVHLPDSRDAIRSKIYSPEAQRTAMLGRPTNVYRLWDKEPEDNPEPGEAAVKYKSLDKRFYFLRAEKRYGAVNVKSIPLDDMEVAGYYYAESFWKLPFYDIIGDYYRPLAQIADRALMVTAELYLTPQDVAGFDFRKLYYIEQLSSYFLMNKISNYIPGRPVKCEMVRVQFGPPEPDLLPAITITAVFHNFTGTYYVYFSIENAALPDGTLLSFKASADNVNWVEAGSAATPAIAHSMAVPGSHCPYWKIECPALEISSNTYQIP